MQCTTDTSRGMEKLKAAGGASTVTSPTSIQQACQQLRNAASGKSNNNGKSNKGTAVTDRTPLNAVFLSNKSSGNRGHKKQTRIVDGIA